MADSTLNYGLPYPDGGDAVAVHSDIAKVAVAADAAVNRTAWNRGAATGGSLDDLADGSHSIPSSTVAAMLGLPVRATGDLTKRSLDEAGTTATATLVVRTTPPEVWTTVRNSDGWAYWSRTDNREPSPAAFGAVGDGVADDTLALRAWLSHLATNGVNGVLDPVTYRVTEGVGFIDSPKPFRVTGAGTDQSRIIMDNPTPQTVLQLRGARRVHLSDFYVGGVSVDRPCAHGIAIGDSVESTVARVRVGVYYSSAVMFFRYPDGTACEGNRIVDCVANGSNIARNGFLLENCRKSFLTNCTVFNLSLTETPSYGLQLKNDCRDCTISGGSVTNALAGVAFGSEGEYTARRSNVFGVTASGCKWGFIGSRTTTASVDMIVDHANAPAGGHPARIGAQCSGVNLRLVVRNVPSDVPVVYVGSSNNSVRLAPIQNAPESLAHFVPLLVNTTVIYEGLASDATVLDESGDPSNHIVGLIRDQEAVTYLGDGVYEIS